MSSYMIPKNLQSAKLSLKSSFMSTNHCLASLSKLDLVKFITVGNKCVVGESGREIHVSNRNQILKKEIKS